MSNNDVVKVLMEIRDLLAEINSKLDRIETKLGDNKVKSSPNVVNPLILLELPDNLRASYMALLQLKEATAEDVASITGRGRAIESHYLNTLVEMGYIGKRRVGRKVHFYLR